MLDKVFNNLQTCLQSTSAENSIFTEAWTRQKVLKKREKSLLPKREARIKIVINCGKVIDDSLYSHLTPQKS